MTTGRSWWKIGDLAEATGVTVRMLRHWDEIGLLPAQRTPSGHRCYTRADLARLYQVLALRQLGLRLDEIAALLEAENPEPQVTLRRHLNAVECELRQRRELRDRLARVLEALEGDDAETNVELLLEVIEKMTMFEQYLTPDLRTWFTQRRDHVGEDAWQAALEQWPQLIAQVRAEMDAGTDPGDPKVQQFLARWDELTKLFIGDQSEIRTATGRAWQSMWAEHAEQLRTSPRVAPPEMWDYIQRVRQAT